MQKLPIAPIVSQSNIRTILLMIVFKILDAESKIF